MSVGDILSLCNEIYCCAVEHCPEDDEESHCHICLVERDSLKGNPPKKQKRAILITQLWLIAHGPERHVCDCDADVAELLSGIELDPHWPRMDRKSMLTACFPDACG
ncbi:MAG: hypothetical protein H6883_13285 [Rhodobiaceae bacterium]|nr:hypothetical protein [Rhodobiaceae bacterium]